MNRYVTAKTVVWYSLLLAMLVCVSPHGVHAATLYFDPVGEQARVGQLRSVSLLLNPERVHINALEGVVLFPDTVVEVVSIDVSHSVIDLWLESPTYADGVITFSGIVPGGFDGVREPYATELKSGVVFTVMYRAVEEGSDSFSVERARAFVHEEGAPEVSLSYVPGAIDVSGRSGTDETVQPPEDDVPPERFTPQVARDPELYEGKYFVTFHTVDHGSGVSHYDVTEVAGEDVEPVWHRAASPYVLQDQTLRSLIVVRAVDAVGNDRIASIDGARYGEAAESRESWMQHLSPVVLALLVLLLSFVLFFLKRRART